MATPTLLDRMRQDMQLRGLAPRTPEAYLERRDRCRRVLRSIA